MWIVQIALRRPYTFVVLAVLIALFGVRAAIQTPTDIFPNISIPVISVVWFGHVTVGLIGCIASACAPLASIMRKVGMGRRGSLRARAGKPSIVISTTMGPLVAAVPSFCACTVAWSMSRSRRAVARGVILSKIVIYVKALHYFSGSVRRAIVKSSNLMHRIFCLEQQL